MSLLTCSQNTSKSLKSHISNIASQNTNFLNHVLVRGVQMKKEMNGHEK